jgi:hypothetical protein
MSAKQDEVPPSEVGAVEEYILAREALDKFMEEFQEIFDIYKDMAEHVNDAMERADKDVRARNVSCGPWDKYQVQTKYDAKALYEAMGRDDFLAVGGKVSTVSKYDVDKAKVNASIDRGLIPPEVAAEIRIKSPRYKAPKEIGLP